MRPFLPGWRTVVRRVALALVSLWVALSILFLLAMVLPGDFLAVKLANLENQGAGQIVHDVVGRITVESTTKAAGPGTTLFELAEREGLPLERLASLNPDLDPREPLARNLRVVLLDGEWLDGLAVRYRVVLPEDADDGVSLLRSRNADIRFPAIDGRAYAREGTALTLHEGVSVSEFAELRRVTAEDLLEVNPPGSVSNPEGRLTAESILRHGDPIILPIGRITEAVIRHRLGIDGSLGKRYTTFLWDSVRFDFGASFLTQEPSLAVIRSGLAKTVQLNLFALIVSLAVGIPLGLLAAGRFGSRVAGAGRRLSALAVCIPSFWLAMLLIVVVTPDGLFDGGIWNIPLTDPDARNVTDSPSQFFALYSIPALSGGLLLAGLFATAIRRQLIQAADPVQPGSLLRALVDSLRMYLPAFVGLNLILELLFNINGLGLLLLQRIYQADQPVIVAIVAVTALFLVWSFLMLDGARALLDRREQAA
ncbi:MAG: ABC transporter permease subunit [Chloroflexi bacterium]|nr:ABC transporter permease subunit [Chloroflexota bacterium]